MKKLKIVSDGLATGTKIVDAETGKPIDVLMDNYTRIVWSVRAGEFAKAVVFLDFLEVDAVLNEGDVKIVKQVIETKPKKEGGV